MNAPRVWLALLAGVLSIWSVPGTAQVVGTNGNPASNMSGPVFVPPPHDVVSINGYASMASVSRTLKTFLAVNERLAGSVKLQPVTAAAALATLRGLLAGAAGGKLVADVKGDARLQRREALHAAAFGSLARSQAAPALACLLRAHELQPADAATLVHLASLALYRGLAGEALALLDAAARSGPPPAGAGGLSGRSITGYLRAYALTMGGRYQEAYDLLVPIVENEPFLSEAALLLALVESKLGKNPRRHFLLGAWRHPARLMVNDRRPADQRDTPPKADPYQEGEEVFRVLSDVFDLTRGNPGRLPEVPLPRTTGELIAMAKTQITEMTENANRSAQLSQQAGEAFAGSLQSKRPAAYLRRMQNLYGMAVSPFRHLPELAEAQRILNRRERELNKLVESLRDGAIAEMKPIRERYGKMMANVKDEGELKKLALARRNALNTVTQTAINAWIGPAADYLDSVRQVFRLHVGCMSGMGAYIGEPSLRRALELETEATRLNYHGLRLNAALQLVEAIGEDYPVDAAGNQTGEPSKLPACSKEEQKKSYSHDLCEVGFEVSCDGVSLEVNLPVLPGGSISAELGLNMDKEITLFVGPKISTQIAGATGESLKTGAYLTLSSKGVSDFGFKGEMKASVGTALTGTANYKFDEMTFSAMPAPTPPPVGINGMSLYSGGVP